MLNLIYSGLKSFPFPSIRYVHRHQSTTEVELRCRPNLFRLTQIHPPASSGSCSIKQQKPNLFRLLVGKTIKHFSLLANTQKLLSEVEKFLLSVMDFNKASRFNLKRGSPCSVWRLKQAENN